MARLWRLHGAWRAAWAGYVAHPALVYLRELSDAGVVRHRVYDSRVLDEYEAIRFAAAAKPDAVGVRKWIGEKLEDFQPIYRIAVPTPGEALLPRVVELLHPGLFRERFGPTMLYHYSVRIEYDAAAKSFTAVGEALVSEDFDRLSPRMEWYREHSIVEGKGFVEQGDEGGVKDVLEIRYRVARPYSVVKELTALYSLAIGVCLGMGMSSLLSKSSLFRAPLILLFSALTFLIMIYLSKKRRVELITAFHAAFSDAVKTAVVERTQRQQAS